MKPVKSPSTSSSSTTPSIISTSNQPPARLPLNRMGKNNKLPRVSTRQIKRDSDEDSSSSSPDNPQLLAPIPEAQYVVGTMYQQGKGVGKSNSKAREWWHMAAENGDASAQHYLGSIYSAKIGSKDLAEAAKWYRKAASQGVAKSQFELGLIYEKGKGVKKDLAEAAKWYGEAAARGDAEAIRKVAKLKKLGF